MAVTTDVSAAAGSLVAAYQRTLAGYRDQVAGRPTELARLAGIVAEIADRAEQVSAGLAAARSVLAAGWSGPAYTAFAAAEVGHGARLMQVSATLRRHEAALRDTATAITVALRRVDSTMTWFRAQAQALLAWSRGVPAGMAAQVLERIRQIGERAVALADSAAKQLSQALQEATTRMT